MKSKPPVIVTVGMSSDRVPAVIAITNPPRRMERWSKKQEEIDKDQATAIYRVLYDHLPATVFDALRERMIEGEQWT